MSGSQEVVTWQKQVILTAEKTLLLGSAAKAQREAESEVAALQREASTLRNMLADAMADGSEASAAACAVVTSQLCRTGGRDEPKRRAPAHTASDEPASMMLNAPKTKL